MNKEKQKRKIKMMLITSGVFSALLVILILLRQSERAAATLFRTLSCGIIFVMGHISSVLPFSLYELLLYCGAIFILASIVAAFVFLFGKKWLLSLRTVLRLVMCAVIIATVYFSSAGFSYALKISPPLYYNDPTEAQLAALSDYFFDDFNYLAENLERDKNGAVISPYTDRELADKLIEEYNRINIKELSKYTPRAKSIFSSTIMSEMGIRGVFFAPFGEANINKAIPDYEKPFTMAHELAHAKGIMREDDADAMAAYVTLTSSDPFIRYSGYTETVYLLLDAWSMSGRLDIYGHYNEKISAKVQADYAASHKFWSSFTMLGTITSFINDVYLKIMGQKEGTAAYTPPTDFDEIPVLDPDTGEQATNPDTGEPVFEYVPYFNDIQRLYFGIYMAKINEN